VIRLTRLRRNPQEGRVGPTQWVRRNPPGRPAGVGPPNAQHPPGPAMPDRRWMSSPTLRSNAGDGVGPPTPGIRTPPSRQPPHAAGRGHRVIRTFAVNRRGKFVAIRTCAAAGRRRAAAASTRMSPWTPTSRLPAVAQHRTLPVPPARPTTRFHGSAIGEQAATRITTRPRKPAPAERPNLRLSRGNTTSEVSREDAKASRIGTIRDFCVCSPSRPSGPDLPR
jgi:hypothetical protein